MQAIIFKWKIHPKLVQDGDILKMGLQMEQIGKKNKFYVINET